MPIDVFHLYSSPTSSCLLPLILAEARVGKQSKVWRFAASSHAESRDEFPRISEITGAKLLKLQEVGAHASNSLSLKPSIRRNLALQKATNHPSHITPNTAAPTAAWAKGPQQPRSIVPERPEPALPLPSRLRGRGHLIYRYIELLIY